MPLFEHAVETGADPTFVAGLLESTVTELRRDDVSVENLDDEDFLGVIDLVTDDELAKEGVNDVLTLLAENSEMTAEEAVEEAGLAGVGEDEVREAVVSVVQRNEEQVEEEGMAAFSGLMGECMGQLRGKADGDLVSQVLREEIQQRD